MKKNTQLSFLLPINTSAQKPAKTETLASSKSDYTKKHEIIRASLKEKGLVTKQA